MDGKERLRRYLEQRRETGERELVLDGMTVDDVMRIVGARAGARAGAPPGSGPSPAPAPGPKANPQMRPPARPPSEADIAGAASGDWRAVLAAADRDVAIPRIAEPAPGATAPADSGSPACVTIGESAA